MNEGELKKRVREEVFADQTDHIGALDVVSVEDVEQILDEAKQEFPNKQYLDTPDFWDETVIVEDLRIWFGKWFGE